MSGLLDHYESFKWESSEAKLFRWGVAKCCQICLAKYKEENHAPIMFGLEDELIDVVSLAREQGIIKGDCL